MIASVNARTTYLVKPAGYGVRAAHNFVTEHMRAMKFLAFVAAFKAEGTTVAQNKLSFPFWILFSNGGHEVFNQTESEAHLAGALAALPKTDVINLSDVKSNLKEVWIVNNGVAGGNVRDEVTLNQLAQIFSVVNELDGIEFDGVSGITLAQRFFESQDALVAGADALVTMTSSSVGHSELVEFRDLPVVATPLTAPAFQQVEFAEETYPILHRFG